MLCVCVVYVDYTAGLRRIAYTISAANFEQGIKDGLARYPSHFANKSLPTHAGALLGCLS